MFVSRNVVSVSEISAMSLIVGCVFVCLPYELHYISSLFKVHMENMLSIYCFQMSSFNALWLKSLFQP